MGALRISWSERAGCWLILLVLNNSFETLEAGRGRRLHALVPALLRGAQLGLRGFGLFDSVKVRLFLLKPRSPLLFQGVHNLFVASYLLASFHELSVFHFRKL